MFPSQRVYGMPSRDMLHILERHKSQFCHPFVNTGRSETGFRSSGTFLVYSRHSHSMCTFVKATIIQMWCSSRFNCSSGACGLNLQWDVAASMRQIHVLSLRISPPPRPCLELEIDRRMFEISDLATFFVFVNLTVKQHNDYLTLWHTLENDSEVYTDYILSTSVLHFTLTSHLILVKWLSRVSRTVLISRRQGRWNEMRVNGVWGFCLRYWSSTNLYLDGIF